MTMTKQDAINKTALILKSLPTKTLKEMAVKLFNDFRPGADFVFESVLSEIEKRIPEGEFVLFLDNME